MGVTRNDYIMIGYKLPYDYFAKLGIDIYSKELKALHKDKSKYRIISDGMNGEYTVFGLVVQNPNEYDGFSFEEISTGSFPGKKLDEVSDMFITSFGIRAYQSLKDVAPKILVFSNFS